MTELLVVIAGIAILIALLFPMVSKTINSAKTAKCFSKLKAIGTAAHTYTSENKGELPYHSYNLNWIPNLAPYLEIPNPNPGEPFPTTGNVPLTTAFLCPDDLAHSPEQLRTYRYNATNPSLEGASRYGRNNYIPERHLETVNPSTLAMVVCLSYTGPKQLELWRNDNAIWKRSAENANPPSSTGDWQRPHYDNKAMNILYMDGHAAKADYPLPPETWNFDDQ